MIRKRKPTGMQPERHEAPVGKLRERIKKLELDFKEFKGDKHIFSEIWKVYTAERVPWETSVLERINFIEAWALESYKQRQVLPFKKDPNYYDPADFRLLYGACLKEKGKLRSMMIEKDKEIKRLKSKKFPTEDEAYHNMEEINALSEKPKNVKIGPGTWNIAKTPEKSKDPEPKNKSPFGGIDLGETLITGTGQIIPSKPKDPEITMAGSLSVLLMKAREEIKHLNKVLDNKCYWIGERDKEIKTLTETIESLVEEKEKRAEIKCPKCDGFVMWIVKEEMCLCMDCQHKFPHPNRKFEYPEKTIEWMVDRSRGCNSELHDKLLESMKLKDFNKMNRWFGYYQRFGECEGYWSLDEIIEMVRRERDEFNT